MPVADLFEARFLDKIRVKGREQSIDIYELLAAKKDVTDEIRGQAESFEVGRKLYAERRWEKAVEAFARHVENIPMTARENASRPLRKKPYNSAAVVLGRNIRV